MTRRASIFKFPKKIKLWDHQRRAIELLTPFLQHNSISQQGVRLSALVNIPTGGGKTAVIGVLAHWHPRLRRVLVVAPRIAIRDQLEKELRGDRGFFPRRNVLPADLPKSIIQLNSANDLPNVIPDSTIVISTIQLLHDFARNRATGTEYDRLKKNCDAIFVDEGHYEPALTWSHSIRGLDRPTVLVTATPYRNDLKQFEFDSAALHVSKYSELMASRILRPVNVVQAPPNVTQNPAAFVESVFDEFISHYGTAPTSARKLIVRCRSKEQIRQIGDLIRAHQHGAGGVICLHENFSHDPARPWEQRQPPDPEAPNAPAIWVHQHKLLEGVDGPSFRALAFYGVLGSARALVQQIGRVVRNPLQDTTENALLIDHSNGLIEDMWNRFLEYDQHIDPTSMLRGLDDLARDFQATLPSIVYADRQFRRRFGFGATESAIRRSLRLPLRCHLYSANAVSTLTPLADAMSDRLRKAEFPFEVIVASDDEIIILFEELRSSPLLADHYFVEQELHGFVAVRRGSVVAVLDTSRPGLDLKCSRHVGRRITREKLSRLLSRSPDTKLVQINSRNSALGPSSVRRRSATAASLEETPPALDEFQFVAASVTAVDRYPDDPNRDPNEDAFSTRSLGFALGRVTDTSSRKTFGEWTEWVERLVAVASDASRRHPAYLDRFAKMLEMPPTRPWPRNILLDLEEAREIFVPVDAPDAGLEIEDTCLDCKPVGSNDADPREIRLIANGLACTGTVVYGRAAGGYEITSTDLSRRYRHGIGTQVGTLVDFLNANQAFSVLPDTDNVVYSEGEFFDPRLGLGRHFDPAGLGLNQMIVTVPELRGRTSEKGARGSATARGWSILSVFDWIDRNSDQILPSAELVVCDDGTRESCDFLLAGKRNQRDVVVMTHAKASRDPAFVSASALHEVCGQASKQVGMLAQFGAIDPMQVDLWHGPWDGPNGEGRVSARVRHSRGAWRGLTGAEIWARLQMLLQRQGTDREVVLVLGASLDRDRLFRQAKQNHVPARAVHCIHLLRSTMAAVGGVNARLRIFCG